LSAVTPHALDAVLRYVDAALDRSRETLFAFLRIPSVSAQPAHRDDCARAAEWARRQLAQIGLQASIRPTTGHPLVLAYHSGPPGYAGPHVLFYGHYDVQPPEPLQLWTTPPFEPRLAEGPHGPRVVARGAVDDKGQVMMFIEALRAWAEAGGGIPVATTVLLEGEEEVGSISLEPWLQQARNEVRADVAVISDTGMWDINTPAVTTRLRGMLYTQVTLQGPNRDLHSGLFGGSALNPINTLTRILGELKDQAGRILIPGFYDDVKEISAAETAQWQALGFDEPAFLREIGLSVPDGERDRLPLERLWSRPTADINGIWGGYMGPGAKTVIATDAHAKISFRLVPDQNPAHILDEVRRFFTDKLPQDAKLSVEVLSSGRPIALDPNSQWVRAAVEALRDEYRSEPVLIGSGGSIPVVETFRRALGIDSLLMGFGLADDQVHSPNEKFEMRCFHHGIRSHTRLLHKLASLA
jgi:acetylornithine deacetylase/succinyl-diaminopimelate desuccinylase-like protein